MLFPGGIGSNPMSHPGTLNHCHMYCLLVLSAVKKLKPLSIETPKPCAETCNAHWDTIQTLGDRLYRCRLSGVFVIGEFYHCAVLPKQPVSVVVRSG